ncbi:hypothetical protein M0D21_21895 [Aquimarina sp. D1M17]|uniref:hypothetical protein n=1 Tax=Aquimarina acroporae TaxID=2937283 RepID=UPI0020BD6884|nr:hypothetical protein [Aquimarina acroporae]MCK8524247.1 hypothetical protein [Aquimarina acroporae]
MKNQTLKQYGSLSSEELTTINGGCGGEDVTCPELEKIMEMLDNLKYMLPLL